jgi:hypothetical protein
MAIVVSCTCGRRLQISEEYAGRQGTCPSCGNTFDLPGATPTEVLSSTTSLPAPPASTPEDQEPEAPQEDLPEVLHHNGDSLPGDLEFFVTPPPEIGPVLTASSSLSRGVHPRPAASRANLALLLGGGALLLTVLLVVAVRPRAAAPYIVLPAITGLLGAGIAVFATHFRQRCSYVGREGVARFVCAGDTDRLVLAEVFLFRDATELRTSQLRHYVNGAYTGTNYTFTWTDVAGQTRYVLQGRYHSAEGTPKAKDPFHFARSAEMAWSGYLLPDAVRQLDMGGEVLFLLNRGNWIRLGRDGLRFSDGGQEDTWDARDLSGVNLKDGVVYVRRHDAREGWFSSNGVLKFDFQSMGNTQLFFFLVERVLRLPVS